MFDHNYQTKLKQIEGVLNWWHTRNLSLICKICVIKTFLLPQYLFSLLCIKIPKYFLKSFIKCFSNLFGMEEMNRVKRTCICNKYNNCVVPVWLTLIISPKHKKWHGSNYYSIINLKVFEKLLNYQRWITNAVTCYRNHNTPESILNGLHSTLLELWFTQNMVYLSWTGMSKNL